MSGVPIRALVLKELRVLLPIWAATAALMMLTSLSDHPLFFRLGLLAFGFGCITLGALVLGHEYAHRTLASLLSQPVARGHILLVKLGMLSALVLALTALEWALASGRARGGQALWELLMVAGTSIFIAPVMTMAGRSALAGAVFSVTIPGLLTVGIEVAAATLSSQGGAAREAAQLWWLTLGMSLVWATAAAIVWPMFARLEAIDGGGTDVNPATWLRPASTASSRIGRTRHPMAMLLRKELRLQAMAFLIAALFVVGVTVLALVSGGDADLLAALSALYLGLLALLIGSLASAEERQLGTHEWQLLMPVPMWQQWAIKAATVLGLSLTLGVALPMVLSYAPIFDEEMRTGTNIWMLLGLAGGVSTAGLYVSSLSSSGVRAMATAFPVLVLVAIVSQAGVATALWLAPGVGRMVRARVPGPALTVFVALALGALVLRFAYVNHRSSGGARRIVSQAVCLATALMFVLVLASAY